MMTTIKQKQKLDVKITFIQDMDIVELDLNEWLSYRQKYIDKGFSEQQAKYFNRIWEKDINAVLNDDWIGLLIKAKIEILMPCGHIEEIRDNIGGYWFDWRKDDLDTVAKESFNNYLQSGLEEQLKEKGIDISNVEYNLVVDKEIGS